ncbi:MAG: EAL domain-containing protein [Gammaproteobacteria bacterium]|nr:EAL domain-containing protein [Gammaproteobacteria bacterium]MDH3448901.1 EAL domain-containing protein [Gammaproteobacteria bacterium]
MSSSSTVLSRIYSFKFIIGFALLWLGALAYGLAIYSTQVYREHAIEAQVDALQSMLEREALEAVQELYENQQQFAFKLQNEAPFRTALEQRDVATMEAWLAESNSRYRVATGLFKLRAVVVRDLAGEIFARSSDDELEGYGGCPTALDAIGGSLIRLLKPRYALCSFDGNLLSEVLVPVGSREPIAYLHVVADAAEGLSRIERRIGMPLKIAQSADVDLYRSSKWVEAGADTYLYPTYKLYGDDAFLGASISAAFDKRPVIDRLARTEASFILITTIATASALLLVLFLLNRAFMPMNKLRNSVGALLTGRYASISEDKLPSELRDLVVAYNEMVEGLEIETISRRQMEEKLRSEKDFISTTLDSITNPVIVIDSRDRIKLVNPSAEKLFGDREASLIDTSIHEVLILYANRQTTRIVDLSQLLTRKLSISSMFFYDASRNLVELEFSASPMIDMEAEDVGFVIILKDVSEDRKLRRKLSYEGSHDQLTGFLNRTAFEQKFETLVTEDNNAMPQHVLAFLDIDQFRIVNETCGSAAGDLLLKKVSSMIKKHVRKSDILSRLSGDEFGIIMPFFEMERALQAIQKIIIEIQHSGFVWNEQEYLITASIGVMAFGRMSDEYAEFYSKVTTACFLAKQNGGNQYHFIDENDEKVMAQQVSMEWVSGIMEGFTDDRFCLYVQPIVGIDEYGDHTHTHYEVLIRYRSSEGAIISPGDFLPPAERYNLIERIDCWVVSSIIAWLQENQHRLDDVMFSINLSGRSIGSQTFHNFLHDSLSSSGININLLCFEITETAVVDNVEKSVEFINSIKKLGAKFSLDDFGTGLSSFSYLKQFPVDYLKIDGEFVRDIIEDDKSFVFVRSMTEVGHCLDMKVIAEFVESDTMFNKLREANVDYIQGYQVGKPVAIETLLECDRPGAKKAG